MKFFIFAALFSAQAFALPSYSDRYAYLANDNEARMLFSAGQMDKLKNLLHKSDNFTPVAKLLTPLYDGLRVRKTLKLDNNHNIEWIDYGIEKDSQIVLVDSTQSLPNQEIFSNFQKGIGVANIIIDFSISPNGQYVDIVSSEYGSIDQVECFVVNIKTREIVVNLHLASNLRSWNSPNSLLYNKLDDDGSESFAQFDFRKMNEINFEGYILGSNNDIVLIENISEITHSFSIQNKSDGSVVHLDWRANISPTLIGNDQDQAYFLTFDNEEKASQIIKANRHSSNLADTPKVLAKDTEYFLEKAWYDGGAIFTQVRAGADRWLRIYTIDGKKISQFAIPDCCSIRDIAWQDSELSVKINFTSPLFATNSFVFHLNTLKWDQDPNTMMLNDRDLHLVSEVVYSISRDGTKIPSRLIHLKDLEQDSSHPVEIETYGGFNIAGYVDPYFDPTVLEFIKRGGIYAGTAVRGGNEYGPSWHQQAMLNDKIKTYEDLASLSDFLVSNKWTKASLIVSRGTSNGGLSVAATALLFPDKFGLVIPIGGVHDLLAKDTLDSVNEGWSEEYGSDLLASDFLETISPLENASHLGSTRFLIIDGANDTRVNPAHSLKLAKALEDFGGSSESAQVQLLTMQNAGHWLESVSYQNSIGLETEIIIWTQIYDLAGLSALPTNFARDRDRGSSVVPDATRPRHEM